MPDDDDENLFNSALTDDSPAPDPEAAPQPEESPETPDDGSQPRDERGRFAPKGADAPAQAQQPQEPPQPDVPAQQPQQHQRQEAHDAIPPWRLKEEAEARRAAEARAAEMERRAADLERQFAEIRKQNEQPPKVPDIYEEPKAFVDHHVGAAIDPVKQEMDRLREFYSQRDAVREHGAEKVKAAYDALDQALRARDPEAVGVYQRVKQSLDPFGDIVRWHLKQTVFSKIGSDPDAWFEQQLEARMKDPAHQAKLLERIRGQVQQQPNRPVTQLPPSLNKATSSPPSEDDDDDQSEGGLLKSALRR
jgi:hypothetical protein